MRRLRRLLPRLPTSMLEELLVCCDDGDGTAPRDLPSTLDFYSGTDSPMNPPETTLFFAWWLNLQQIINFPESLGSSLARLEVFLSAFPWHTLFPRNFSRLIAPPRTAYFYRRSAEFVSHSHKTRLAG